MSRMQKPSSTLADPEVPEHKPITLKDILDTVQEIKESCSRAQHTLHGVLAMEARR